MARIKKQSRGTFAIIVVFIALFVVFAVFVAGLGLFINRGEITRKFVDMFTGNDDNPASGGGPPVSVSGDIEKFASLEEFKEYIQKSQASYGGFGFGGGVRAFALDGGIPSPVMMESNDAMRGVQNAVLPDRISGTNVQVAGIDEPDIVKTDGKEIYFSSRDYYARPFVGREMMAPSKGFGKVRVVKAFPPSDLALDADIDASGDMLLTGNTLVVFSGDKIYGYDVSDPKKPGKKWTTSLKERNSLAGARLYKDKIYLITKIGINVRRPCPIVPLSAGETDLEIKCVDIYHPVLNVPVDVTYTAMTINPASGEVENTVSFVGSSGDSVIYVSENAIYVTYSYDKNEFEFFNDFVKENAQDLFPKWLVDKIAAVNSYDISNQAKLVEFQVVFEQYYNSLDNDERLRVENEFTDRMNDYVKAHKRELEKTGIVKIGLDGLGVSATGVVPGRPLNQFSMDEYGGNLRIAVTIGGRWGVVRNMGGESASDIYVLDKSLNERGSVKDLGLTERIYSARFIEDKGYIVTFRQTDPFYVLDLSDPGNPALKGELKIPGYSSYLHPITKDKIIGVGKEGSKVKISMFGVSSPENPVELDKYTLDEYWSDVLNTHRAFLMDKKHGVFFMPGGRGGYVFSYKDDKLSLKKAVSNISAKRAIYLDDYMYIIGENKISVLDENNWKKVKELEF